MILHVGTYKVYCFLPDAILKQKSDVEQKPIENRLKLLNYSVEGEMYFFSVPFGTPTIFLIFLQSDFTILAVD